MTIFIVITLSLLFIGFSVAYAFIPRFRQGMNYRFGALGYMIAVKLRIATWVCNLFKLIWKFARFLLFWVAPLMVLVYVVFPSIGIALGLVRGDMKSMVWILMTTAVVLFITAVLQKKIATFLKLSFGLSKFMFLLIIFFCIIVALTLFGQQWFMDHRWLIGLMSLAGLVLLSYGQYRNIESNAPATILVIIFMTIVGIHAINHIEWPRWMTATQKSVEAELDRYSNQQESDAGMTLAKLKTSSVLYTSDAMTAEGARLPQGSWLAIANQADTLMTKGGQDMPVPVYRQNDFGDFVGEILYAPSRKLELHKPSEYDGPDKLVSYEHTDSGTRNLVPQSKPWLMPVDGSRISFTNKKKLLIQILYADRQHSTANLEHGSWPVNTDAEIKDVEFISQDGKAFSLVYIKTGDAVSVYFK